MSASSSRDSMVRGVDAMGRSKPSGNGLSGELGMGLGGGLEVVSRGASEEGGNEGELGGRGLSGESGVPGGETVVFHP